MGRTYQVLTGGFLSFHPLRTTMKAVLALLIICLIQISFAENVADDASSVANLLLQREVRDAGKGGCEPGDKKCKRQLRKEKGKERKKMRKGKKQRKAKTSKTKKGKKGGKKGGKGERKEKTKEEDKESKERAESGCEGVQIFISKWKWKEYNWPVLHRHGRQDQEVQQGPGRVQAHQED